MAKEKATAQYAPPASQVDLEERRSEDYVNPAILSTSDEAASREAPQDGRDYTVEGNELDGYVGVSPEYMNYANETEKPEIVISDDEDDRSLESELIADFADFQDERYSTVVPEYRATEPRQDEQEVKPTPVVIVGMEVPESDDGGTPVDQGPDEGQSSTTPEDQSGGTPAPDPDANK